MMFSPKYAVAAAVIVSVLLAVVFLSAQGVKAGPGQPVEGLAPTAAPVVEKTTSPVPSPTKTAAAAVLGSASLDLGTLAKSSTIDEADNARWSLVRTTGDFAQLYDKKNGVNWAALRKVTRSGAFKVPAGAAWSFNQTFQGEEGYKKASGVLAGGQCALATVFRAAALHAGLPNQAKPHRYPIPGFPLAETVNIWWGRDDLTIQNPTGENLNIAWKLTPQEVVVTISPAR